jgi:cell division transport system permease protein
LVIFGIFLLVSLNLNQVIEGLKTQPELEIFCDPELNDKQISEIEAILKSNNKIKGYSIVSKKEALEQAKQLLGKDGHELDGEDESFLPVKFVLKLKNLNDSPEVVEQFKKISGIEKINYSQDEIDFVSKITYWIRLICGMLLSILIVISVFIISNTIKLTVFARRREINIMKFIGATDWFIRWPFIVEGIVIGITGALVAFILLGYGYSTLEGKLNTEFFKLGNEAFNFIKMSSIGVQMVLIYCVVGGMVGAIGSMISLRKHLQV